MILYTKIDLIDVYEGKKVHYYLYVGNRNFIVLQLKISSFYFFNFLFFSLFYFISATKFQNI